MNSPIDQFGTVRQLTFASKGHLLTNVNTWSPDGRWLVYDTRSDASGSRFDGESIERVNVDQLDVQTLYQSTRHACCGVATYFPRSEQVVFIHGPEDPDEAWSYNAWHRRGVVLECRGNESAARTLPINLDARDIVFPFTPGALRGGTHVHVVDDTEQYVSFTYEDHVLAELGNGLGADSNQRNVGVCWRGKSVQVPALHRRNHDGSGFSVLVTQTVNAPRWDSDEIERAYEDAWIGRNGYLRADGQHQSKAIAFLGDCRDSTGEKLTELFVVDLPSDLTMASKSPLEGTATKRPCPPRGTLQRRVTHTQDRRFPGIRGPRHWPRSHPNGSWIATLMADDHGQHQIYLVDTVSGLLQQLTDLPFSVESCFTWSPDGESIAFVADGSVMVVSRHSGKCLRLTPKGHPLPRPEACVFSPKGDAIAFLAQVHSGNKSYNQIFVVNQFKT